MLNRPDDCWWGQSYNQQSSTHHKNWYVMALKCSSSFTISSVLAEYCALLACLLKSLFSPLHFYLPAHNWSIITSLCMKTVGQETGTEPCKLYSSLKNIMFYSSRNAKKVKSICHQMHRWSKKQVTLSYSLSQSNTKKGVAMFENTLAQFIHCVKIFKLHISLLSEDHNKQNN